MNCDRARRTFYDNPSAVERSLLRLHLLRCPACRAEAHQIRALDAALGDLPRFAPSAELLPTVLAQAQAARQSANTQTVGRACLRMPAGNERKTMKKLAYALAFLIVIGLLAGGLLIKPDRPDGRSLLISAAQAMEEANTIYVRGRPNIGGTNAGVPAPPWGFLGEGHYEHWYSPEGSRHDIYDADGNLDYSSVMDVASGIAWIWSLPSQWFPDGLVTTYPIGTEALADIVEHARQRYLDGELCFADDIERANQVTTYKAERNGRQVTVVEVDQGMDPSGLPVGTVEFYIDPATGHLLGLRQYGPDSHGKPLTADMEIVEYGIEFPSDIFDFNPPPGVVMLEDDFEIREGGGYCLHTPASFPGPWKLTPTDAWHVSASNTAWPTKPEFTIDGDPDACWSAKGTRSLQEPGMWFQLDFDAPVRVSKLRVQHGPWAFGQRGPAEGWPRGIQISATYDGVTWEGIYTGQASSELSAYGHLGASPEILGLRFELAEYSDEEPWTISEIALYGRPD